MAFGINLGAKTFRTITNTIYKNKIKAIIRELSCNAVDGQRAAGYEGQFDVHLPTVWNKVFRIRDYGTGMSREHMDDTYFIYFKSDKGQEDNGSFGLGGKSPLAYVNEYHLNNYQNGKVTKYRIFYNREDIPDYDEPVVEDTDEPDGCEVIINLEGKGHYDFSNFLDEAKKVFAYFPLKPRVFKDGNQLTDAEIDWRQPDIAFESPDYVVRRGNDSRIQAIIGNVAYPIVLSDISNYPEHLSSLYHSTTIDIRFDKSDVDIQPSREEISYNEVTRENVIKKLEAIKLEIYERVIVDIESCSSLYECNQVFHRYFHDCGVAQMFPQKSFMWKGKIVSSEKSESANFGCHSGWTIPSRSKRKKHCSLVNISFMDREIFVGDIKKAQSRANVLGYLQQSKSEDFIYANDPSSIKALVDYGVPLKYISDLPEVAYEKKKRAPVGMFMKTTLYSLLHYPHGKFGQKSDFTEDQEFYYVLKHGDDVVDSSGQVFPIELIKWATSAFTEDQNRMPVYAIPKTHHERIIEREEGENLIDTIIEILRNKLTAHDYDTHRLNIVLFSRVDISIPSKIISNLGSMFYYMNRDGVPFESDATDFLKKIQTLEVSKRRSENELSQYSGMVRYFTPEKLTATHDATLLDSQPAKDFLQELSDYSNKYPLLNYVLDTGYKSIDKIRTIHAMDYIDLVRNNK